MIDPTAYLHCGFGVLLAAISIPLVLRRIPMNHVYGFRLRSAFVSDACWYDINELGGRIFFVYGVLLAIAAFAVRDLAPAPSSPWSRAWVMGPLVFTLVLIIPVAIYGRSRAARELKEESRRLAETK